MWLTLKKLGVPETTVQPFHNGMEARICIERELLEEIKVENGLRQGLLYGAGALQSVHLCNDGALDGPDRWV